mmetsp:Transcript_20603/g.54968  ORF Transcript_20603/g.54968 Transcript_20603/m.54968 type:complete len:582 (+) Transcript_20603:118-1863(+)
MMHASGVSKLQLLALIVSTRSGCSAAGVGSLGCTGCQAGASGHILLQQGLQVQRSIIDDKSLGDELALPSRSWESLSGALEWTESKALASMQVGNYTLREGDASIIAAIRQFLSNFTSDILSQHAADQRNLDTLTWLVQNCSARIRDFFEDPEQGVNTLKQVANEAREQHSGCRRQQLAGHEQRDVACDKYHKARVGRLSKPPACMPTLTEDLVSSSHADTIASMEDCVRQVSVWSSELTGLAEECRDQEAMSTNQSTQCGGEQKEFESQFCLYAEKLQDACSAREACQQEVEVLEKFAESVLEGQGRRQIDLGSMERISCLLDVLESHVDSKADIFDKCDRSSNASNSSLGITYLPPPDLMACSPEPSKPCENAWSAREYEGHSWRTVISACTPCVAPLASTTPAPPATSPEPAASPGGAHRFLRFESPETTPLGHGYICINELSFFSGEDGNGDVLTDAMTEANVCQDGGALPCVSTGSNYDSAWREWRAFDHTDQNPGYCTQGNRADRGSEYLQIEFEGTVAPKSFRIAMLSPFSTYWPHDGPWFIKASSDGNHWETLHSETFASGINHPKIFVRNIA